MIVCYQMPISNYEGTDVFEKHLYVKCENISPSHNELLNILQKLADEEESYLIKHPEHGPSMNEWLQCLETINLLKQPVDVLSETGGLIGTSVTIIHPKFGKQSFSISRINLVQYPEVFSG